MPRHRKRCAAAQALLGFCWAGAVQFNRPTGQVDDDRSGLLVEAEAHQTADRFRTRQAIAAPRDPCIECGEIVAQQPDRNRLTVDRGAASRFFDGIN